MKNFLLLFLFFIPISIFAYEEGEFPQIKINRIDARNPFFIKIYASFLDKRKAVVKEKYIEKLEVYLHKGREKPIKIIEFKEGKAEEGKDGKFQTLDKTEEGIFAVFIFAGHQDPQLRDGTLGKRQKTGAGIIFKALSEKDRANIIWYGDRIYSFIKKPGKEKELSNLSKENEFCLLKRFEFFASLKEGKKTRQEKEQFFPCGLFNDHKTFKDIIQNQYYEGFYPNLFDLRESLCIVPENKRLEEKTRSAFSYAIETLISNSSPNEKRVLAILSDGKDGYIFAEDDCKIQFREKCLKTFSSEKQIALCIQKEVEKLQMSKNLDFKEKLLKLLPLLLAEKISVFSVGYPNGLKSELERLRVLSLKTGGTYRSARDENDVPEQFSNLIDELTKEMVISFKAELEPEKEYAFSLKAFTKPGIFKAPLFHVVAGKKPSFYEKNLHPKKKKLEEKVGPFWSKVIIVLIILISLFLLFFFGKLFIKLIKKIIKRGK